MVDGNTQSFIDQKVKQVNHAVLCIATAGIKYSAEGERTQKLRTQEVLKNASSLNNEAKMMTDAGNYYALELQYNPQSISFHSTGGRYKKLKEGAGAKGSSQILIALKKGRLTMSVTLKFRSLVAEHAFFSNRTQCYSISEDASKQDSVQWIVEGLIGSLSLNSARNVIFFWADMCFSGVLNSVTATYNMFNIDGSPCSADVKIEIVQTNLRTDAASRKDSQSENDYWEQAYKRL